jgi:hypothetical protein
MEVPRLRAETPARNVSAKAGTSACRHELCPWGSITVAPVHKWIGVKKLINRSVMDSPNSDLENETPFPSHHCEHLKGAWQSHRKRRDCFGSLAMTIFYIGIWG